MLTIRIETDNAAFGDRPEYETARILRRLADRMENTGLPDAEGIPLRDINGNRVGKAVVSDSDPNAAIVEACKLAQDIIKTARQYFPKSIKNRDRFELENTNAAIGSALHAAR